MSKISDLSNAEISRNIIKYKQRVIDQPDHEEYGKILKALQIEEKKRSRALVQESAAGQEINDNDFEKEENGINGEENSPEEVRVKNKIEKHHSSSEDFSHLEDASTALRFFALLLDGFFTNLIGQLIGYIVNILSKQHILDELVGGGIIILCSFFLVPIFYILVPVTKNGQTLGKKIFKIKIVNLEYPNENMSYGQVFKREFLGKFASGFAFFIGYLVRFAGKPTWHDSFAHTRVVKLD